MDDGIKTTPCDTKCAARGSVTSSITRKRDASVVSSQQRSSQIWLRVLRS